MSSVDGRAEDRRLGAFHFVSVVVLLAVAVVAAGVLLAAIEVVRPEHLSGRFEPGREALAWLDRLSWPGRLGVAAGALAVGVLCLSLPLRLIAPAARSSSTGLHMLEADERGFVVLDSAGVATFAEQAALTAQGVVDARARVRGTGTSPVRLRVDVSVYPGADVKQAGAEARRMIRESVERYVGVDVKEVAVKARVIEVEAFARLLE